jgi:hypothetical protein
MTQLILSLFSSSYVCLEALKCRTHFLPSQTYLVPQDQPVFVPVAHGQRTRAG